MGPIIAFSSFALAALAAPLGSAAEVSLNWVLPERAIYAGENVPVALEITLPEAWLGENLLQLFPQPLDLPLQVSGFEALQGARLIAVEAQAAQGGQSVVVDGVICHATGPVLSAGAESRTATYTVQRWFTAPRAGTIQLPGAGAHYAFAAEFRDDFVQGRVPVDRTTADAIGESSVLEVAALPESNRPFEFAGAVGGFMLTGEPSKSAAQLGETISLLVRVEAPGGQPAPMFEARDLQVEASDAFVEQGRSVTQEGGALSINVSFAAKAVGFHELPTASLTLFDPTLAPPAYRVARTAASGVQVRATTSEVSPPTDASEDAPVENEPKPTPYWTLGVGIFIFAIAVASVIRRRIL